jgi:hypothetical protein
MMKKLTSNTDLYEYLLSLGNLLSDRRAPQLAESVRFAARQSTGLSTEFLGESGIALRGVLSTENGILRRDEREELQGIIGEIEFALRR